MTCEVENTKNMKAVLEVRMLDVKVFNLQTSCREMGSFETFLGCIVRRMAVKVEISCAFL